MCSSFFGTTNFLPPTWEVFFLMGSELRTNWPAITLIIAGSFSNDSTSKHWFYLTWHYYYIAILPDSLSDSVRWGCRLQNQLPSKSKCNSIPNHKGTKRTFRVFIRTTRNNQLETMGPPKEKLAAMDIFGCWFYSQGIVALGPWIFRLKLRLSLLGRTRPCHRLHWRNCNLVPTIGRFGWGLPLFAGCHFEPYLELWICSKKK